MLKLIFLFAALSLVSYTNNGIEIISSDENHLVISFNSSLNGFDEVVSEEGNITYKPKIIGSFTKSIGVGLPEQYYVSTLIAVPSETGYQIEMVSSPEFENIDNLITPTPKESLYGNQPIRYELSPDYFNIQNPAVFSASYLGKSSGINLIRVDFLAAFFNSDIQKTSIVDRTILKISFDSQKNENKINPNFPKPNVINPENINQWASHSNYKKTNQLQNASDVSSGNWVKIRVEEDGFYRITSQNLADLGFILTPEEISSIKIFGYGGIPLNETTENDDWEELPENEIIVNTSGGNLSEVIFYGNAATGFKPNKRGAENYVNWYDEYSYYMLTWGGREGIRAGNHGFDGEITNRPEKYKHHYLYSEELLNLDPSGSGRQMVGNLIPDGKSYETELYDLDKSGEVIYRVALAHKSASDSEVDLFENGTQMGTMRLLAVTAGNYKYADRPNRYYSLPASSIPGNKSIITMNYRGSITERPYMDFIEIQYPRPLKAIDNELTLFTDYLLSGGTEYAMSGFSGSTYAVDATDPTYPKFIRNYGNNSNPVYRLDLVEEDVRKIYVSSKLKTPTFEIANVANLRYDPLNTDMIVITHNDLLNSANKFKEYREANSDLSVSVVSTESIYNEFGTGTKDIAAIRNFLKLAYSKWDNTPRYVLLWGDGHSDHKNLSIKEKVYVPIYHSADSSRQLFATSTTAHDDFFTRVDGNDALVDMISGRVPLYDSREFTADQNGENYVAKLDYYENQSSPTNWRKRVALVADDGLQGGGRNDKAIHVDASEDLTEIPNMNKFIHDKIYLIEYQTEFTSDGRRKPTANNDLISTINDEGTLLLNWSGHGNPYVWAHENVFNQEESIRQLNNKDRMFFATAATCSFGQFDSYSGSTAAEDMLVMNEGGAIGLFAATRLVYALQNAAINEQYFEELLKRNPETGFYPTVGEALFNVKQLLKGQNDEKYLIMGDPSLRLLIPDYRVVIDSFPEVDLPDDVESPIIFKGLSQVKLVGHIETPAGIDDPNFNGNLELSVFDGDKSVIIEEFGEFYYYNKYGGILNKSSTTITNGKFEVDFILPKDISYSDNFGRMFAFAVSDDNEKFAKGNFNDFKVFGVDNNSFDDSVGPNISIYLDSREFEEGDIVSREPLLIVDLEDNIGINSTGVGIGHRIEAWVNDNIEAIDMTPNYTTRNGSNRQGTTNVLLRNLKPGLNKVTVRAWDLFNNFNVAETYFYLPDLESTIWISDMINYPNPFTSNTTIKFQHNLEPGFEYFVNIFDIEGRLIRQFSGRSFERQILEIDWDGKDEDGGMIMSGSYLIQANVVSVDGFEKNNAGIISFKVN